MFEFIWKPSCKHDKITPNMKAGYCTDCGEYVQNHWYISRCECCGLKQNTWVKNGKVVALDKFCKNCGSHSFVVEELKEIDVITVNYATVLKQVQKTQKQSFIQAWIEENSFTPIKLLPSY